MKSYWINPLQHPEHYPLLREHFELRKRVFIDQLKWSLSSNYGAEFDQYDYPAANYCLTYSGKTLAACARVIPTDARVGHVSYMIRDLAEGKLAPELPPEIAAGFKPAQSPRTWEATRLAVSPELELPQKRIAVKRTVDRMVQEARSAAVENLIALGGPELHRGVSAAGHPIKRLTPYHPISSGKVAIFNLKIIHF